MESKASSIYDGHFSGEQSQNAANKQHARPYSYLHWNEATSIYIIVNTTCKTESSKWIKAQNFCSHPFAWQKGYGAFSYAKSQVADVIRYVQNQEIHHRKETFLDEYRKFLTAFEIEWDEQYIFKELE